jgi:site-specific DNA-methyltransferase (adenine-specific)
VRPTWEQGDVKLYLGDCLEVMPHLERVDAVITDPPYGMGWNGKVTRGKNGTGKKGKTTSYGKTIANDDIPFDPSALLKYDKVVMFGYHHFSDRLPLGSVLIWLKRYDTGFNTFLSDADLAWSKGGEGVYCFRDLSLQGESKNKLHPTQKPIPLMQWVIRRTTSEGDVVYDPFMGSGTTGVAAVKEGRKFIGIEIDPEYFEIAKRRIMEAQMQPRLIP